VLINIATPLFAPLPVSRDLRNILSADVLQVSKLEEILQKLCVILDIKKYESTFDGGLCVYNRGGENHDNETIKCWDHPLHITNSDTTFEGVNIIKLKENITFKPNANTTCPVTTQQAAIIVEKDDMTIDFSGFAIVMDGQKLVPNPPATCTALSTCTDPGCIPAVHGVHIKPGIKNTRIISTQSENTHIRGSIKSFTGFGIYIEGDTGTSEQIDEVFVNNMRIYNCYNGIYAQHASHINITRTETNNNCNYNTVYGMQFMNVAELYIIGSQASSNQSCNNVYGIYMQDTSNAFVQDTETSRNMSSTTTVIGSTYGIYVTATNSTDSFANTIKDCKVSRNICADTANSECIGIYVGDDSAHNIIQSNLVISNSFAGTTNSPNAYGIRLNGSNFNEITENKVGSNANLATSGSSNPGISDSLSAGSTSLFTSNVSFFNGYQGKDNYNITFKSNVNETENFSATIMYSANLEGISTTPPVLGNLDIRKAL